MSDKSFIMEKVLETVVFFDMFDYPMAAWELFRFLPVKAEPTEVVAAAEQLVLIGKLAIVRGFFCLPDRNNIVDERQKRYAFTKRKIKRAGMVASVFSLVPWVKAVAVANLIGAGNLRDDSDIDLFIVAEPRRIWLVRFFLVAIAMFFRWRPSEGDSRDKICLSFFLSGDDMDLSRFCLRASDGSPDDRYFCIWLAGLVPVLDRGVIDRLFLENKWLEKYLPNYRPWRLQEKEQEETKKNSFFDKLEKRLMTWQINRFPPVIQVRLNHGIEVVVDESVIKLHVNDRRAEFARRFSENYEKYR